MLSRLLPFEGIISKYFMTIQRSRRSTRDSGVRYLKASFGLTTWRTSGSGSGAQKRLPENTQRRAHAHSGDVDGRGASLAVAVRSGHSRDLQF